ncbi:MAG: hypothetical protein IPL74_02950 [Bacteroidetes bacterium]|nr:hypothetical protein [Bacteroidota bacterium]
MKMPFWDNLLNMYKRFNSHEIKGARLQVSYHDQIKELVTDEDGYFGDSILFPKSADNQTMWHFPKLELLESAVNFIPPVEALAKVVVPPATAKFGVISDIDDTILKTNATSILKQLCILSQEMHIADYHSPEFLRFIVL